MQHTLVAAREAARLTYFAGWGLAEQGRWMLAAAGIHWDQVALQSHEEFLALRKEGKLLFGQLPLLEIDGLQLVQSQAIVRYVAQKGGLWGTTASDSAVVDMLLEGIRDCRAVVVQYPFASHADQLVQEVPDRIVKQMAVFEASIVKREDNSLGFLKSGLSAADVLVAELVEGLLGMRPDVMGPYPTVASLHRQVVALPGLASYLASDKRYPFPKEAVKAAYVANVNAVLGR